MTFLTTVIPLDLFDLSMISAQTRSAFVARENRRPQGPSGLPGGPTAAAFLPGQFVICATSSALLNILFSAVVMSAGVFAVK